MSKYRLGDFGTIMKGEKDFCQYDEPYKMISELNKLERQLAEAREDIRKAFDWALNITDDDFNSRDYAEDDTNKIKNILWEEYKEQNQ